MRNIHLASLAYLAARGVVIEALRLLSLATGTYLLPPPGMLEMRLTLRCNLRCRQCDEWRMHQPELPFEFWAKTIQNYRRAVGPYCARFYGGEPFCRRDLLPLLAQCSQLGIITFITTNGTLIDETVAEELSRYSVALISISLDGCRPETHDRLRGVPGTHRKVIAAIDALQKHRIPVQLNTTIMQDNLEEIVLLADFARDRNIPLSFQGYFVDGYREISGVESSAAPNHAQRKSLAVHDLRAAEQVVEELCRRKKSKALIVESSAQLQQLLLFLRGSPRIKKKHCEAMGARLMIKNTGEVWLCSYGGPLGSVGNLTTQSFGDLWRSKPAREKLDRMMHCRETNCLADRGCYKEGYLARLSKVARVIAGVVRRG